MLQTILLDIREEALALLFTQRHGPSLMELVKSLHKILSFEGCLRLFIRNAYASGQYVLDRG